MVILITEVINALMVFFNKIQRVVISGGNFKPDTLKPKEVVSLLLDDDELEKKCECFDWADVRVSLWGEGKYENKHCVSLCSAPKARGEEAARGEQQGEGAQEEEGEVCWEGMELINWVGGCLDVEWNM